MSGFTGCYVYTGLMPLVRSFLCIMRVCTTHVTRSRRVGPSRHPEARIARQRWDFAPLRWEKEKSLQELLRNPYLALLPSLQIPPYFSYGVNGVL